MVSLALPKCSLLEKNVGWLPFLYMRELVNTIGDFLAYVQGGH